MGGFWAESLEEIGTETVLVDFGGPKMTVQDGAKIFFAVLVDVGQARGPRNNSWMAKDGPKNDFLCVF